MAYLRDSERFGSNLPLIHGRPISASTYDLTSRQRLADDRRVRYGSPPRRSGLDRDSALYPAYDGLPAAPSADAALLNDQLRYYRDELAKKDSLISQLTSIETQRLNGTQIDDAFGVDPMRHLNGIDSAIYPSQLRECHVQLEMKDAKIRELKRQLELSRETEVRHAATVQQLQHRLGDCDSRSNTLGHGNATVVALKRENTDAHNRIVDLESRLRTHMEERERAEQERMIAERRLNEITSQFYRLLFVDGDYFGGPVTNTLEQVLIKTQDIVQDNTTLRAKLSTMQEYVDSAEMEQKSNRETIRRLMNDQQSISHVNIEIDNCRLERDNAIAKQKELLAEIDSLKDRLDASQRAWSAMRREVEEQKIQRTSEMDREKLAQATEGQARAFKECLALMLSDNNNTIEPYEEMIRARIQNLLVTLHDKSLQIESFEGKLSGLAAQLDAQYELNRVSEQRAKRAEADILEMEARLRRAECNMSPGDAIRLSQDRYIRFLEHINRALNMEPFPVDFSLDGATSAIIARAEQLGQCEALGDRKTLIYNLQRKVKSLKEKLANKEMRVEEMHRKLSCVEDRMDEKDDVYAKNRKLVKLIDKYRCELTEAHREICELKSRLLITADAQTRADVRERDLANLEVQVNQLEVTRQRQADEIAHLKDSRHDLGEKNIEMATTTNSLAEELNRVKFALDDITRRNKQLMELRRVIARMLGLNVGPASAADFEIVTRLEKLILASRSSLSATVAVDDSFAAVAQSYREGHLRSPSPEVSHSHDHKSEKKKSRSRSLSPVKKPDPKVY